MEQRVCADDVRRALHAAGAELRVAEESSAERFVAHLTDGMPAGSTLPVFRWRGLSAVKGCHDLLPKNVVKISLAAELGLELAAV